MFSLILSIVGVVLVAALALATLYYGGQAFLRGGSSAAVSKLALEGQQISAALTLHKTNTGQIASDISELTPTYLQVAPPNWGVTDGYAFAPQVSNAVCLEYNQKLGVSTVPACSDAAYAAQAICCSA